MKQRHVVFLSILLIMCAFRDVVASSDAPLEIIEQVNTFILQNPYNRSLFVHALLQKYAETKNTRFLKLLAVYIDKKDPLYDFLVFHKIVMPKENV